MEPLAPEAARTLSYHSVELSSPLSGAHEEVAVVEQDVTSDDKDEADEDEDFCFNAPSFYDLTNPGLERHYVNNADGYFSSLTPSGAASVADSHEKEQTTSSQSTETGVRTCESYLSEAYHHVEVDTDEHMEQMADKMLDTTMVENELDDTITDVDDVLSRSHLLIDRHESFEDVFRHYASSSQSSIASSCLLQEADTSTHSSIAHGQFSPYSSLSSAAATTATLREARTRCTNYGLQTLPSSASTLSSDEMPSKLMQPTQSYLRRLQADQRMREQSNFDAVSVEEKPHRATRPRSPKMHVKSRLVNPNDPSRMSSTSRELLKIQEERLHLQLEKLKIREFHEKTKVQRPPANVHLRSTKQLTVPLTPRFAVQTRIRRCHSGSDSIGSGQARPSPPIAAEKLLSRDFALLLPLQSRENRSATTAPHAPQLRTAARAVLRPPPAPISREKAKSVPICSRLKVGGLTQPMTPQLETSRRAATHRRPVEVIDHDSEELAKKFQARPLNRHILQPKAYSRYSSAKPNSKVQFKQPTVPKLLTSARSANRMAASDRAASVAAEMERHRKEREQRVAARQAGSTAQHKSVPVRRPVIPETPPLKSIQLHREYQASFRRKIEAEEEKREKQHVFRANPMRVTATPPKFEGSTKPVTEVEPFELPGERFYDQARERLEQARREEEQQCLKSSSTFRAKPMPLFEPDVIHAISSTRPLTQTESPMLATKSRAVERAAFEASEKERREREQAFLKQREQQERQLEEEEIKRLRREEMIFHALPVPDTNHSS